MVLFMRGNEKRDRVGGMSTAGVVFTRKDNLFSFLFSLVLYTLCMRL